MQPAGSHLQRKRHCWAHASCTAHANHSVITMAAIEPPISIAEACFSSRSAHARRNQFGVGCALGWHGCCPQIAHAALRLVQVLHELQVITVVVLALAACKPSAGGRLSADARSTHFRPEDTASRKADDEIDWQQSRAQHRRSAPARSFRKSIVLRVLSFATCKVFVCHSRNISRMIDLAALPLGRRLAREALLMLL